MAISGSWHLVRSIMCILISVAHCIIMAAINHQCGQFYVVCYITYDIQNAHLVLSSRTDRTTWETQPHPSGSPRQKGNKASDRSPIQTRHEERCRTCANLDTSPGS